MTSKKNRVIIYIDSSNLYKGAQNYYGNGKLLHRKLCEKLANGRQILKVKYFCVDPPEPLKGNYNLKTRKGVDEYHSANLKYVKQLKFLEILDQWKKIELIRGRLQRSALSGKMNEKGVDVALAIHLIADALSGIHDVSILITGDADLVMPVRIIKNQFNIEVEGAAFQPCYHIMQAIGRENFKYFNGDFSLEPFLKS